MLLQMKRESIKWDFKSNAMKEGTIILNHGLLASYNHIICCHINQLYSINMMSIKEWNMCTKTSKLHATWHAFTCAMSFKEWRNYHHTLCISSLLIFNWTYSSQNLGISAIKCKFKKFHLWIRSSCWKSTFFCNP